MSEDGETKATTQAPPSTKNEEDINKKVHELDEKELAIKILEKVEDLDDRMSKIEEEIEKGSVEVINNNAKILEKYPESKKKKLVFKCFKEADKGVEKDYLMDLFNVEEDQARNIMKRAGRQYDFLEWQYPGGPVPGKLYHTVSKLANEIAELRGISEDDLEDMQSPKLFVLDEVGWDSDKMSSDIIPKLKRIKENLEAQNKKEEKKKQIKKQYGGLF